MNKAVFCGLYSDHSPSFYRENVKRIALGAPWHLCNEGHSPHMCLVAKDGRRNRERSEIVYSLPECKEFPTQCSLDTLEVVYPALPAHSHRFLSKGHDQFLVVIDSHFKWLEVRHMCSTTTKRTVGQLRLIFAQHG